MASEDKKLSARVVEKVRVQSLWRVELSTKESGYSDREMGRGNKNGLMDHDTKASGRMAKLMDRASSIMQMVTFTKVIGLMTKLTEMEHIHMQMEQSMWDNGETTNNTDLDWRPGLMVQSTRVHTSKERRMEKAS